MVSHCPIYSCSMVETRYSGGTLVAVMRNHWEYRMLRAVSNFRMMEMVFSQTLHLIKPQSSVFNGFSSRFAQCRIASKLVKQHITIGKRLAPRYQYVFLAILNTCRIGASSPNLAPSMFMKVRTFAEFH